MRIDREQIVREFVDMARWKWHEYLKAKRELGLNSFSAGCAFGQSIECMSQARIFSKMWSI